MKQVPLSKGMFAVVDDEDFPWAMQFKWSLRRVRQSDLYYAVRYVWNDGNGKRRSYAMHREIIAAKAGSIVDHKNHNGLDNRRGNLRACSNSENIANRRGPTSKNTSGVRGVSWSKISSKWLVRVGTEYVGLFSSKIAAAAAYAEANRRKYGEFGGELCCGTVLRETACGNVLRESTGENQ